MTGAYVIDDENTKIFFNLLKNKQDRKKMGETNQPKKRKWRNNERTRVVVCNSEARLRRNGWNFLCCSEYTVVDRS